MYGVHTGIGAIVMTVAALVHRGARWLFELLRGL